MITPQNAEAGARASEENDDEPRPPAEDEPAVVFEVGDPPARVFVELARSPRQIQRGLMYRRHLQPDRGMLFLFPRERVQSFWMKNTLIPLDMIFVTSGMEVAGVVENAEPLTEVSRSVGKPSQYVIEVNAGWASAHGVVSGTPVRFENVSLP